jgi:hypothetical protein
MKPPYFNVTAICRQPRCSNVDKEFTRQHRSATYKGSDDQEHPKTDIACPYCRNWGRIIKTEEVKAC